MAHTLTDLAVLHLEQARAVSSRQKVMMLMMSDALVRQKYLRHWLLVEHRSSCMPATVLGVATYGQCHYQVQHLVWHQAIGYAVGCASTHELNVPCKQLLWRC